jgi:hypothetical protein
MRVSFYFERSCPEQRPRAALKPQEPRSWTPGAPAPAEVLAGRGVVVVESWQVASCKSYLCSREGGPHTLPTLRPLSHNANPRDGAQDIYIISDMLGVLVLGPLGLGTRRTETEGQDQDGAGIERRAQSAASCVLRAAKPHAEHPVSNFPAGDYPPQPTKCRCVPRQCPSFVPRACRFILPVELPAWHLASRVLVFILAPPVTYSV